MTEIKFRVWDKQKLKWFPLTYPKNSPSSGVWINNVGELFEIRPGLGLPCALNKDVYETQFYTGLKDKNGKEIYKGDIVQVSQFNGIYNFNGIAQIVWSLFRYTIEPITPTSSYNLINYDSSYFEKEITWYEAFCKLCKRWRGGRRTEKFIGPCTCGSICFDYKETISYSNLLEVIGNIFDNPELLEKKD